MGRRSRWVLVPAAAIALLAAGGCADKGPKLFKVSGTVKYKDGAPVPGADLGKARINFAREGMDEGGGELRRGANSKIEAGGRFVMGTFKPGDGVIPGKYKVGIMIWQKDHVPATRLIPETYENASTSGLDITVDKQITDHVFQVDKLQ